MQFIFKPVAQNTIIRPLAQAVCLIHGGETTKYTDPEDHKEKVITSFDVSYLHFETIIKGRKVLMGGNQVAFHAKHYPQKASIKAKINDVDVYIYPTTTVSAAMEQFHQKISKQNIQVIPPPSRQRDS